MPSSTRCSRPATRCSNPRRRASTCVRRSLTLRNSGASQVWIAVRIAPTATFSVSLIPFTDIEFLALAKNYLSELSAISTVLKETSFRSAESIGLREQRIQLLGVIQRFQFVVAADDAAVDENFRHRAPP